MPDDRPQEPSAYEVLEVRSDASSSEISRAYRRLARAWHPDARPVDAGAAARFRSVSDAYELLSDPARRAAYDRRRLRPRGARPRPPVSEPGARGPAMPSGSPFPGSAPPLWPLGPATTDPLTPGPRPAPGGPALRPGPVRIEPLAGHSAAGRADAEARLHLLARFVRAFLGDDRSGPW